MVELGFFAVSSVVARWKERGQGRRCPGAKAIGPLGSHHFGLVGLVKVQNPWPFPCPSTHSVGFRPDLIGAPARSLRSSLTFFARIGHRPSVATRKPCKREKRPRVVFKQVPGK